ncbi:hypothetical protein MMCCUG48898_2546 [Mycobacteroides abscessus subsp. massiliense CCUG 48898 = JCM 15300]|nr:hypothetical protein MA4S0303_2345 [Mycobacteroides abscessus 4S-0303]EIV63642.1 hypothetical protein MMCCUG48898_2546 [Mycobacteroides abscessus subsp. massiliense CCUG 48898 = JCM 15300]
MQPKWLRRHTHNVRISIEQHQMITFQPGFMTYMLASRSKPPQAWVVALTSKIREVAGR